MRNFKIFTRTWWAETDPSEGYPNNLKPEPGRKKTIGYAETEEEARKICQKYNASHKPGRYSRKAEFDSI